MAISQIVPGSKLMPSSGMSSEILTRTLKSGDDAILVSLFQECIGSVPVFGDLLNATLDSEKTDISAFIALEVEATTVTFELLDGACNVLAVLDDNTYGIFFPKGFAPGNDFFQQQYIGFRVQWRKVLDAFGAGLYQIRITTNWKEIVKTEKVLSCLFDLCQYTDERADETVRIETIQNGKIISESLDFLGLNWRQQYRIKGFFGHKQRSIVQDSYLNKSRTEKQIQDTLIHDYMLEPYLLNPCLRFLIDQIMLANDVIINDYNLDNTDNLKNISCVPVSVETEYFNKSQKAADVFKFKERNQDRVKRNVR